MPKPLHVLLAMLSLADLAACSPPQNVVHMSDERRIWVVRQAAGRDAEVYRCADGATPEQPPKPVCIRSPLVQAPE